MTSPWKIDPRDFTPEARRFLSAIRRGRPFAEAAERARVDEHQPRTWLRDKRFAEAFRRAQQGGPTVRIIDLNRLPLDDDQGLAVLRRRRDAGQASAEDLRRLKGLERR